MRCMDGGSSPVCIMPADRHRVEAVEHLSQFQVREMFCFVFLAKPSQTNCLLSPGLGCGCFAGRFKGQLGRLFGRVLRRLLREHGSALPGLAAVYYDPFDEGSNKRLTIEGVSYIERPLRHGNEDCPQLCLPAHYEEEGDDFSDCLLFRCEQTPHTSIMYV